MKTILSIIAVSLFSISAFAGFGSTVSSDVYDVLFIVDDSGSMSQHQQKLHDALPTLMSEFKDANVHMGFTTSSALMTQGFIAGTELLGKNMTTDFPGLLAHGQDTIKNHIGTNGEATEVFYNTIFAVLTDPANEGFMRTESKLIVVVVTDEGDQSNTTLRQVFLDLTSIKKYDDIRVHGIMAKGDLTCGSNPEAMAKIEDLVLIFNGTIFDLCEQDWSGYRIPMM